MRQYTFDEERRIWFRPEHTSITYNDGDESENYLETVLKQAHDVSSTSPDLRSAIRDWPSEYHLSLVRHNLLRFCNIEPGQSILELGCGCGAITRYLGEIGGDVIAVEGSARRASIAAERCRDLPNVHILCDNIACLRLDQKFDVVTLIGVLEYAQLFIEADDPVQKCLQIAKSLLNENGVLIVAIENQLGLKYLNGCKEDHLGIPYYGVHGLYDSHSPITFGKKVLTDKLNQVGFASTHFSYPFPDYKLPSVLLAEEAFHYSQFKYADLLHRTLSRDRAFGYPHFNENLVWRVIGENGLLSDLANSFLVRACLRPEKARLPWIAAAYSCEREPKYITETTFRVGDEENIVVRKKNLFFGAPIGLEDDSYFHHIPATEAPYIVGELYVVELQRLMQRGAELEEIGLWAKPWLSDLQARVEINDIGTMVLPSKYIDAIPTNLILKKPTLDIAYIDDEWHAREPVPFFWIAIRGLVLALATCVPSSSLKDMQVRDVIVMILNAAGYEISDEDFATAAELECKLQKQVKGVSEQHFKLLLMHKLSTLCEGSASRGEILEQEISRANHEIIRIKNSFSWRLTKPLRFFCNLPSLIKNNFSK